MPHRHIPVAVGKLDQQVAVAATDQDAARVLEARAAPALDVVVVGHPHSLSVAFGCFKHSALTALQNL